MENIHINTPLQHSYLNSYKNIQWTQLTDDIVEYMLPMLQKEFDSLYNR